MPITLNGNGTVTGITVGGLPDGIVDTDMLAANAVNLAKLGATTGKNGPFLQVKQTVKTDVFSQSVATGTDSSVITGLTVSITASSATNKILIIYQVTGDINCNYLTITKDGSSLTNATGDASGNIARCTGKGDYTAHGYYMNSLPLIFLDTAGDTNAHTYGVKVRHASLSTQDVFINRRVNDNVATNATAISTVTALEVAA